MNFAMSPRLSGLLAGLALLHCALAAGQGYPAKAVHIVLPVSGGGIQDNLTRAMTPEMTRRLGQPVIVDNRGGANGIIASEYVAHSAPDGYTILMCRPSEKSSTRRGRSNPGHSDIGEEAS